LICSSLNSTKTRITIRRTINQIIWNIYTWHGGHSKERRESSEKILEKKKKKKSKGES
jgi:hypothetical protein